MPADEPRSSRPGASGRTRSSTEERERTAAILRAAAEAGFLSLDEADERMATCYQSQYRDELAPLLADLPDHGSRLVPPDPAQQAAEQELRREAARGLTRHAGGVVFIGVVLVGIWALSGGGVFWPAWPLTILVLTMVFHAKHRARRYRWRQYAAHNGFPEHWAFSEQRGFPHEGPHRYHRRHHCRPSRNEEEYASRSW